MKQIFTLLVMVIFLSALTACQSTVNTFFTTMQSSHAVFLTDVQSVAPVDPALIEQGYAVYRANYCSACHALSTLQAVSQLAPTHDHMGETAAARIIDPNYRGNATTPTDYIRESIVEPRIYFVNGYARSHHPMPGFSHLSDADINALVAMLLSQ